MIGIALSRPSFTTRRTRYFAQSRSCAIATGALRPRTHDAEAGPEHFERSVIFHDDRAQLVAMVGAAFGAIVTTFSYDSDGQLIERRRQMGALSDESTTFVYDSHGNPVHERTERRDREMRLDENGGMQTIEDIVRAHESRFEYTYDSVGNWTERVVSARFDSHAEFQRTNVERRAIAYYKN